MELRALILLVLIYCGSLYAIDDSYICDEETSIDISVGTRSPNGDINFNGVTYKSSEYIVDSITGIERGCICAKEKCIRKCCPLGYGYNIETEICIAVNDTFDPPIWDKYKFTLDTKASELFKFIFGIVNCSGERSIRINRATNGYHLLNDGNIYLELLHNNPPWMIRPPDKYCLDTFVFEDPATGDRTTRLDALICFAKQQEDEHHYILSATCMLISCLFILATLAVYGWLPELRNLHGKVLMVYLICLFGSFLCSATMQILLQLNSIPPKFCEALTFIIYFFLLSAFFWLNVMSFDIWWTFSGKRGMTLERLSARTRFYAYSMYAFGVPTMLTILLAALEYSDLPSNRFLPLLRYQGCFLNGNSKLIYLYGPMVLVILANLIFFVLTALKITQISRQTSVLKSKDSTTHDQHRNDKQRLFLYVKLFTIMGINWILEVLSAIYPKLGPVWLVTDTYNVLIGVFVFIIFVCKRKIFRLIKKRYHQLRGDPMSRTHTSVSTRTFSSRDEIQMGSVKSSNNFSKNNNTEVKFN
ncbi:hypothetical protein K1T71_007646 [Dendrolimus kikuchii]|uniref:Uncharacterized protein n=1 Tax=Dendrolimus kikuchii TaxID=765133 RepID=A0ACC1CZB1_9NEOP|nr:hypothetical protein K1T71_007646 [Dendrolimus kikuchii]